MKKIMLLLAIVSSICLFIWSFQNRIPCWLGGVAYLILSLHYICDFFRDIMFEFSNENINTIKERLKKE